MALTELARFLPKVNHHNRYLRSGMRPHSRDDHREPRHDRTDTLPGPEPVQPDPGGDDLAGPISRH
jgi:putative (di)nucleoside polyphosphate hydrolase